MVMGGAWGYQVDTIRPFVTSLRKHYHGPVMLHVNDLLDPSTQQFYQQHDITCNLTCEAHNTHSLIQEFRHQQNLILLQQLEPQTRVFVCDTRDVIFQQSPFVDVSNSSLELFLEPQTFGNCTINSTWIAGIYGHQAVERLHHNHIICAGTVRGSAQGVIGLLQELLLEIDRIKQQGQQPVDQPILNYLVHGGVFPDYGLNQSGESAVATMHHHTRMLMDRQGRLLNHDGSVTPVVHQWDRMGAMAEVILKAALT